MKTQYTRLIQAQLTPLLQKLGQLVLALGFVLALAPNVARAQAVPTPPERLSYQGYLTDANGTALATNAPKNYDVIFRIWNDQSATAAANRLWAEQQTVTVDKGYFSVLLGEGSQYSSEPHTNLSGLFAGVDASERYVEFTVKGIGTSGADVTILPRLRLLSSPYAFLARNANALVSPNGASLVTSANGQLTVNGSITGDGSGLTALNASQLTTGIVPNGRLGGTYSSALTLNNAANSLSGNGSGLFSLNAGNVASGTLADARLSGNVALRNGGNTFNGSQVFTAGLYMDNSQTLYAKNAAAAYEAVFWPRWSDNVTYLNYGVGGFNVRNNSSASRMFITDAGDVGFGTTAPGGGLHVVDANWPTIIAESSSTVGTWISLRNTSAGGHNWNFISTGRDNGEGAGKLLLNDQTSGGTVLALQSNGSIGIGTASPSKAALEVAFSGGNQPGYNPIGYINTSGAHTGSVGSGSASIWASGFIFGSTIVAFSDERMKNVKGPSDSAADLKTLLDLQITDYTYRDTLSKGAGPQKKVIAQQVERVYPQAVTRSTDVVPDIFTNAVIEDGWVKLATDLKVGDRVQLISERETSVHEVLAVRPGAFRTDFKPAANGNPVVRDGKEVKIPAGLSGATNRVFVYGREVKDFRSVDYDAIAMLNVSATQELARRLEKLEARERRVAELEQKASRVATLEQEVAELKQLVVKLADASKGSEQAAAATLPAPTQVAWHGTADAAGIAR